MSRPPVSPRKIRQPSPNIEDLPTLKEEIYGLPYSTTDRYDAAESSKRWAESMYKSYLDTKPQHVFSRKVFFNKLLTKLMKSPCPPPPPTPPPCTHSPRQDMYRMRSKTKDDVQKFFGIDVLVLKMLAGDIQEDEMWSSVNNVWNKENCNVQRGCFHRLIHGSKKGGRKHTRRHKMRRSRRKTRHSRR
jgi:hypothetical protein